ncbi:uncharacterized protein LACBIDRAFT_310800 [Laccaria bicolor S238N-H82]|uniref:Predicted protein n=1 Tax=Laccaria bicolor (strain S238N-H82 / ATCC MYA-4686) TaxID=486041 RepID=B0DV39_LACBS|nr:uncharacterized protein LACBIDRAFT_310800 [Laccaria bicolor S238N-H82]EDR01510.1 predicted protein [Laccaria bicolor S238N-H82]|eukprot:XP_001887862.1 predicted protein [Laccaria bicolor S238N-H82]
MWFRRCVFQIPFKLDISTSGNRYMMLCSGNHPHPTHLPRHDSLLQLFFDFYKSGHHYVAAHSAACHFLGVTPPHGSNLFFQVPAIALPLPTFEDINHSCTYFQSLAIVTWQHIVLRFISFVSLHPTAEIRFFTFWQSPSCYDSPLVMHHTVLKSQAPLSPPPTQPMSTLALPPTDAFHDVTHATSSSSSSSCLSPILSVQGLSPILSATDSLDGTDTTSSSSYQSTLCLKSEGVDPLLSPLSPEWDSNSISHMQPTESLEHSYLLRDTPSMLTSSPLSSV